MNQSVFAKGHALQGLRNYPAFIWLLGFGSFVNIVGLSLLWPVNAIYIHSVLGKSVTMAGVVLMIYSGAGFLGSALGGWLSDRIGPTRVLAASLLISCLVILLPALSSRWWVYLFVMVVFGMTCSIPFPVMNALAGQTWPSGGRRAFNFLYVANNLGVAVGTALGGLLAEWSFHSVFIGIAGAYSVFFIVVLAVFRPFIAGLQNQGNQPSVPDEAETAGASRLLDKHFQPPVPYLPMVGILVGFMVAWVVYVQWQCTISVYMQALHFSLASYSVLWTLNGILIFISQPLVMVVNRRLPNLRWQMVGGVLLYIVAFALLLLSHQYFVFVIAMIVMTLGEVFVWPSVPAAIAVIAPTHRAGFAQGVVQSAATLGRMLGPLVGGWLYDNVGMPDMLTYLVPVLLVSIVCFLFFVAHMPHQSAHTPSQVSV